MHWMLPSLVFAIGCAAMAADFPQLKAERLDANPIITAEMFVSAGVPDDGKNINGPSLIRVPDWLPGEKRADPKANYYLYFADHNGLYIRMAWAERVEGPYNLYKPGKGVLSLQSDRCIKRPQGKGTLVLLSEDLAIGGHVASPDVHVDDANRRFVMFFHAFEESRGDEGKHGFTGPDKQPWSRKEPQKTFVTSSVEGLDFNAEIQPKPLSIAYLRPFQVNGKWYGSAHMSILRAADPGDMFNTYEQRIYLMRGTGARHTAVRVGPDHAVTIFFSNMGGEPEHLQYLTILGMAQSERSKQWKISEAASLLMPETAWEGGNLPLTTSEMGKSGEPARQLQDPAYFRDTDGSEYLLYSAAGEKAIAIARLRASD